MRIIDISQAVGVGTAVWPGDHPFELEWTLRQDAGDSVNVAAVKLSPHTGTHTDGGLHVSLGGTTPIELPLAAYLGKARVIDARGREVLDERAIEGIDFSKTRRVLFRTREAVNEKQFPSSFLAPTPGLARTLAEHGVQLVGSDAPSMDGADSKDLASHHIFADAGVATLENLVLTDVAEGEYTLIALPLKLKDADSSPVRAVLIEGEIE